MRRGHREMNGAMRHMAVITNRPPGERPCASGDFRQRHVSCCAGCCGNGATLIAVSVPRVRVRDARCELSENPSTTCTGAGTVLPSAGVELRRCEWAWAVARLPANSTAAQIVFLVMDGFWHDFPGGVAVSYTASSCRRR